MIGLDELKGVGFRMEQATYVLRLYGIDNPTSWRCLGNAGGFSGALFWRGEWEGRELLLRSWPPQHPSTRRLQFIHRVLEHAVRNGCRQLAIPLRIQSGESFVQHDGRLWQVEPWMPGAADFERNGSAARAAAALEGLADFHRAVADWPQSSRGVAPTVQERLDRLDECQQMLQWQGAVRGAPNELRFAAEGAASYQALVKRLLPDLRDRLHALAEHPVDLRPAIRDIWSEHVYFDGDEVSGIVDFGALRLDWQLTDVARLVGSLCFGEVDYFQSGIEAYCGRLGLDSEPTATTVRTLDESNTVITPMSWITWLLFQGRRFDDMTRVRRRFEIAMSRLRRLADGRR